MKTIEVPLEDRSYPVYIGHGLLQDPAIMTRHMRGNEAVAVTNETVEPLYMDLLRDGFRGHPLYDVVLPDGERYKTLETCRLVFDGLMYYGLDRSVTVVALGGGVIGDMAGFCAATYQRGVACIQVPTTLLAQVDAAIGGKTGVNHPMGKNMIGAFHQPRAVIADTQVLETLPEREYRAGLAEVIKYGAIRDPALLEWLEANTHAILRRNPHALEHIVSESVRNKAEVVAKDELESGERALLNFGHTFGHAIETWTGYASWLHGEAVAVGMVMAARMSVEQGWLAARDAERLEALIQTLGLPTVPPRIPASRFRSLMSADKKARDRRIRLVLLRSLGDAVVTGGFDDDALTRTLATYG